MSRSLLLTEGSRHTLALNPGQVGELNRLAFALSGTTSWWGESDLDETEPRALTVTPLYGDQYAVTVANAVGVIGCTALNLVVQPKIPLEHFAHVASHALSVPPRLDDSPSNLGASGTFLDLVARWFVGAVESLQKLGLARDYAEVEFAGPVLRGRLDARATMELWSSGRALVAGVVDEFDFDIPLNRVLRAATLALRGSRRTADDLLPRLGRVVRAYEGISDLRSGDLDARPRRGQMRYELPLALARQILAATGPGLETGSERGQTFLFSSPPLVEEGIRSVLRDRLSPVLVRKVGRQLNPSTVRVNPDLVIGDHPYIGDVKYKTLRGGWNRPDLAQAVLFATAFRSPFAVIVAFGESSARNTRLQVGDISVAQAIWDISPGVSPQLAEDRLVESVAEALSLFA